MEVRCERCDTEYEFDDALVTERGVPVKCTQCGHLFTVFRSGRVQAGAARRTQTAPPPPPPSAAPTREPSSPGRAPTPAPPTPSRSASPAERTVTPAPGPPGAPTGPPVDPQGRWPASGRAATVQTGVAQAAKRTGEPASAEAATPLEWLLRRRDGGTYRFQGLRELRGWVLEGRVAAWDQIAPPDAGFQPVTAYPELAALFRAAHPSQAHITAVPAASQTGPPPQGLATPDYPQGPTAYGGPPPEGGPGWTTPPYPWSGGPGAPAAAQRQATPSPSWSGPMLLPPTRSPHGGAVPRRDSGPQPVFRGYSPPTGGPTRTPAPSLAQHRDGFGEFDDIDEEYLELMGLGRKRRWLRTIGLLAALLLLLAALGFLFVRSHRQEVDGLVQRLWGSETDELAGELAGARGPRAAPTPRGLTGGRAAAPASGTPTGPSGPATASRAAAPIPEGPAAAATEPPSAPTGPTAGRTPVAVAAAPQAEPPGTTSTPPPAPGSAGAPAEGATEPASPRAVSAVAALPAPSAPPHLSYDRTLRRARDHLLRGRNSQALAAYEALLKRRPRSVEALTGLGWCHINLGRAHIAVLKFKAAGQISPGYGEALIGLGKAHRILNQPAAARAAYQRYLSEHPTGSKASIARAALDRLGPGGAGGR